MLSSGIPNTYLFIFIAVIAVIVFYVVWNIIVSWRIFVKAGEKGWKALIPIYDVITTIKIIDNSRDTYTIYFVLLSGGIIMSFLGLSILSIAALETFYASLYYRIAKRFGQSSKFAVGAALVWPTFGGILAFSKAEIPSPDQGPIVQSSDAPFPPDQQQSQSIPTQPIVPSSKQSAPSAPNQQAPLPPEQPTTISPVQPNQPPNIPTV
ncbi:hypothetical protein IKG31_02635 [Candidatus Saccharibacteria bacterium]|nr:hypothetical protein [Candidatus Saccharibacteria bacterium]